MARSLPPYPVRPMDIAINAHEPVDPQVRAYIEYRMFSAVSRFCRRCVRLRVRLVSTRVGNQHCCTVALDVKPTGQVRARATANHLYAAVDQSAERLSRAVQRRLGADSVESDHVRRTS